MLFAGSASFVAIGAGMLAKQGAMMWFWVLFFALCAAVFAAYLLSGSPSLTLDAGGFQIKQWDLKSARKNGHAMSLKNVLDRQPVS